MLGLTVTHNDSHLEKDWSVTTISVYVREFVWDLGASVCQCITNVTVHYIT